MLLLKENEVIDVITKAKFKIIEGTFHETLSDDNFLIKLEIIHKKLMWLIM